MKQYLELLKTIKEKGTYKPPAREGMPGTQSLFGYQLRHDLSEGFPLLTTKKMFWKGIVVELLWFLRGDTNIKYLVDNGVNIWNEDAYNYYKKQKLVPEDRLFTFGEFINAIKENNALYTNPIGNYRLGDCGYQYGKVWRQWDRDSLPIKLREEDTYVDQIANLIEGLKKNPESRRHIVTAWDPAHDQDLALTWCHAMFQFNCRPMTRQQRIDWAFANTSIDPFDFGIGKGGRDSIFEEVLDSYKVPKYYLDCQLYQRSADVVLGVPFNIASYALLTHIICKIVNMVPGEFIHTFGDVHIYDNHLEAVEEQLSRIPGKLPTLLFKNRQSGYEMHEELELDDYFKWLSTSNFVMQKYNPQPSIKAELSTGLKK